jgi:CRISPR-associated endoribonuclease Cas6
MDFVLKSPNATLYISSPMIDTFIRNFVIGTFEKQSLMINTESASIRFDITQVESLPEIEVSKQMKFTLLSPLVLSTKKYHNGKLKQYYLRPEDTDEINRVLTQNLINKYKLICNKENDSEELQLEWDKRYISRHERVTKKVTVKESSGEPIDIIGIQAPFTISGNPELIRIGYEAGFGEKNSMGFGMVQPIYY